MCLAGWALRQQVCFAGWALRQQVCLAGWALRQQVLQTFRDHGCRCHEPSDVRSLFLCLYMCSLTANEPCDVKMCSLAANEPCVCKNVLPRSHEPCDVKMCSLTANELCDKMCFAGWALRQQVCFAGYSCVNKSSCYGRRKEVLRQQDYLAGGRCDDK